MAIRRAKSRKQIGARGFTLVEVIISTLILTAGIVGLLAAFAASIATLEKSREDSIARQEAQQFLEGIYAARNSGAYTNTAPNVPAFEFFQNASQDPHGLFLDGMQTAKQAGPDGLMNTADDLATLETGPDGKPLQLTRQIAFTPLYLSDGVTVNPDLRKITVTILYGSGSNQRTYTEVTYLSNYR